MRQLSILLLSALAASAQVKITPEATKVHIEIDGKAFGDFIFKDDLAMKPYLWPLRAASGTAVTRNWPMETVSDIEPKDHQHQRGLWFGPDDVNGFDFWNNESNYPSTKRGRMVAAGP